MSKKRRKTSGRIRKKENRSNADHAKLAIKQGNYDKAIIILQSASSNMQEDRRKAALAELYFQRAYRYYDTNSRQALEDLRQAAKLKADDALYAYHLGLKYHRDNQLNEAIEWYDHSLNRDANFERALFPLALAHQENGDDIQSLPIWQRLTDEQKAYFSDDDETADDLLQGLNAATSKKWEAAETHFQAVIADKSSISSVRAIAYDYLGRLTLRRDDTIIEQAIKFWNKAYHLGLRSTDFLENFALGYIIQIEAIFQADGILAEDLIQEAIQYFPDHPRLQEIQSHLQLSSGYMAATENDWQAALSAWQAVNNAEGEVARRLSANLGLAYEKLEMWHEAAVSWREFAKRRGRKEGSKNWLSPEQVARLWSRISNLYMRVGEEDEAITTLQTALKYEPDSLDMGVELARRYAESGRVEASHNQIDRVTQKHKKSPKALAFKAELSEIAPQGWGFTNHQAMTAWDKVIQTGDEGYVDIAQQRLKDLYLDEFERLATWGFDPKMALKFAEEGLKKFPDFSVLRAQYIGELLEAKKSNKQIKKQLDQIDLTDENALHRLVDIFHIFEKPQLASDLLNRANTHTPLKADFYTGVAGCAVNREQYDIADGYFADALKVAEDENETKSVLIDQATTYASNGMYKEAEILLKGILKQDAKFGPAHLTYAMVNIASGDEKDAKWHLKKAEKWAKEVNEQEMIEMIEEIRFEMDNPLARLLPPGFDPSMLPPDFLDMALDGGFDMFDDFDEED